MSYLQFEKKMRGTREIIFDRLKVYTPLIVSLKEQQGGDCSALDIGSGRGEWLELLQENGWSACGVDTDHDMIALCQERGLTVIRADGKSYLEQIPPGSLDLISAFHVIEHISIADLPLFIQNCRQALKPNGVLLFETPNPQNLLVGTSEFYVDPTHTRPVPPKLLSFMATDAGFPNTRIVFLNGQVGIDRSLPQLADVILGVGYDYALVAQKSTAERTAVDEAMSATYRQLEQSSLESRILHFDGLMRGLPQNARLDEGNEKIAQLQQRVQALDEALRHQMQQQDASNQVRQQQQDALNQVQGTLNQVQQRLQDTIDQLQQHNVFAPDFLSGIKKLFRRILK